MYFYKKNKYVNTRLYNKFDRGFPGKLTLRGYQPSAFGNIYRIDIKMLLNSLNAISSW